MEDDTYETMTTDAIQAHPPATITRDNKDSLTTAATMNPTVVTPAKPQSTGKSCAMILVGVIATIAITVLAIIVISVIFSPQSSNSNSDIQVMKQQIENMRMAMSQIQQSNASLFQATFRAEISLQSIQDMIDNSIQQLQVQVNNSQLSIKGVEGKVKHAEENIENMVKNLTVSAAQVFEEIKFNTSQKFKQLEIQLANTSGEIQLDIKTITKNASKSAADILALQLEMQVNSTAIRTEIEQLKKELTFQFKSAINATKAQEILQQRLSRAEIQLNDTHSTLKQL